MQVKAEAKRIRISPLKARVVTRSFVGLPALEAIERLRFVRKKAALPIRKLIASAVADAKNNFNLKAEDLMIVYLTANKGPSFKRYWLRARGRADRIMKPTTNLKVVLDNSSKSSKKERNTIPGVAEAVGSKRVSPARGVKTLEKKKENVDVPKKVKGIIAK